MLHLLAFVVASATLPIPIPGQQRNTPCFAFSTCNERPVACFAAAVPKPHESNPCNNQQPKVEPIIVMIAADGTIVVDGHVVALQDAHKSFKEIAVARPNSPVRMMIDVNARYGTVLQVLDAANTAGLHQSVPCSALQIETPKTR